MSQKTVYCCDICGAEKKETNHWFRAWPILIDGNAVATFVIIWDLSAANILAPHALSVKQVPAHLCGEACVTRWQAKTLGA